MGVIAEPALDGQAETTTTILCALESPFTVGDSRDAFDGTRPLYFYGFVAYATSFDRVHEYYRRYENNGSRWLLTNYEDRQRGKKS
jgi:hypothetical protein